MISKSKFKSITLFCYCFLLHFSLTLCSDTLSLHLTNQTTFDEVVQNITTIHKSDKHFAKIETDQIAIYRDNFCYKKIKDCDYDNEFGGDRCSSTDKRIGVCLRLRLFLVNNTSFYMFVSDEGIYYNSEASGNYTIVEGKHRGIRWYENYIEEQLELRGRTYICPRGEERLPKIYINGTEVERVSYDELDGCTEVCLSRATLQGLWHIQISAFTKSVVWCFTARGTPMLNTPGHEICASPFHIIRTKDGKAVTMQELCQDSKLKCELRHEEVAKAVLYTQKMGEYAITFVAARTKWIRSLLLTVQLLLDALVYILLNQYICLFLFGLCIRKICAFQAITVKSL